jgi:photosystem II stability/assembly factor-like uncharacterized protein
MRRLCSIAAAFFACGAIVSTALPATAANPFDAMHWRMIGPFRGGRTNPVVGVPGQPNTFYTGAVDGGVWKTEDAGRTWQPIFDAADIASIGAMAVAPSDPDVLYVGSGEADMRSDITYGDGMYKSTDAGKTWTHIGLEDSRQIGRVAVAASDPDRVFVAALGHAFGPNTQRGVYRSTDGGQTWQRVLYKDENTGAIDVVIDPNDANTVFAALWQTRRPPWNVYPPSNGPGGGLYVSHDGGTTWTQVTGGGFPSGVTGRMGIAFAPSDPARVYVILDAAKGGLYRSDDRGATWHLQDADQRLWQRGWYFCTIAVDGKNADTVYISDTAFYRSTDGGAHFTAIKGSPDGDDFHQPWVDPSDSTHVAVASDQGTSISVDGGDSWSSWFNQPTGQFYHITADNRFPFWVYGAQQDNGAAMVPTQTDSLGITSLDWRYVVAGGEAGFLTPDPRDPDTLYGDNVTKEDLTSGQAQSVDPTLAYPAIYRGEWTLPLVFSPTDPRVMYYGRQVLFRSADGGNSWHVISPDLTRPNPGVPSTLDATTAANTNGMSPPRGVIYTIAPSPVRKGELWAGTDDGNVWITWDEGAHWRDVTPVQLGPWSKVGIIEASSFDANTAYAAIDRHRLDDIRPYLYRTRDGGKTWTSIADGIPNGAYVNAVREDPSRKGLLYAGTELGVYVSFDDGAHWSSLRLNMPIVSIRDLVIRQDSLAIATHGRAFWVLDDLSPLHQYTTDVDSAPAWLYAPETAIRVRPHADPSERYPPEEPAGENRKVGAFIDYLVDAQSNGPLTLSIYDASGALVRAYSSADNLIPYNPDDFDFPSFWLPAVQPLSATAGMHRFVWDFHYAPLPGEGPSFFGPAQGPLAPPGKYVVKLSAAGHTWSQPLVLAKDPRVKASDADLVVQFTMARDVEQLHVVAMRAFHDALKRGMKSLAGGPGQNSPDNSEGAPQTELASLYSVAGGLDGVEGAIESADAAPTHDQEVAIAHWKTVLRADLKVLGEQL